MADVVYPSLSLMPHGEAWLEFGPGGDRPEFEQIAERLRREFGATATESRRFTEKDYLYLNVEGAELLLMWKAGLGTGLSATRADLPILLRVADAYDAPCRGWRWHLYRLTHRSTQAAGC